MATRNPTAGARRVPHYFEDYLASRGIPEVAPQKCTGCLRDGGRWDDGTNVFCEPCMRYQHGYDQAEEKMVRTIIGAAIAAALEDGSDSAQGLVRAALEDALAERVRVEID